MPSEPRSGAKRSLSLVHSSDLHLSADAPGADPLLALRQVLEAARRESADAVLLAGDIFDHNRQPLALLEQAARLLDAAAMPVVILPGNHDPLTADSVYRNGGLADPDNVLVLGVTEDERVRLADLDLEIWGRAHLDYVDMAPLRDPPSRRARWRVVMAHGHYLPKRLPDTERFRPSWLMHDDEIAATAADYVALGHWNHATRVGPTDAPAYYSGSPDIAGTVNVVRLSGEGVVAVHRSPLASDSADQ